MLEVKLPIKVLDERAGMNLVSIDCLAAYFYPNKDNDYKPWYIFQIPFEWQNRNWQYDPLDLSKFEHINPKRGVNHVDNLWITGPNGILDFEQADMVNGPAAKARHEQLLNLEKMKCYFHAQNFHPTKKETIVFPIFWMYDVAEYVDGRYKHIYE